MHLTTPSSEHLVHSLKFFIKFNLGYPGFILSLLSWCENSFLLLDNQIRPLFATYLSGL